MPTYLPQSNVPSADAPSQQHGDADPNYNCDYDGSGHHGHGVHEGGNEVERKRPSNSIHDKMETLIENTREMKRQMHKHSLAISALQATVHDEDADDDESQKIFNM